MALVTIVPACTIHTWYWFSTWALLFRASICLPELGAIHVASVCFMCELPSGYHLHSLDSAVQLGLFQHVEASPSLRRENQTSPRWVGSDAVYRFKSGCAVDRTLQLFPKPFQRFHRQEHTPGSQTKSRFCCIRWFCCPNSRCKNIRQSMYRYDSSTRGKLPHPADVRCKTPALPLLLFSLNTVDCMHRQRRAFRADVRPRCFVKPASASRYHSGRDSNRDKQQSQNKRWRFPTGPSLHAVTVI